MKYTVRSDTTWALCGLVWGIFFFFFFLKLLRWLYFLRRKRRRTFRVVVYNVHVTAAGLGCADSSLMHSISQKRRGERIVASFPFSLLYILFFFWRPESGAAQKYYLRISSSRRRRRRRSRRTCVQQRERVYKVAGEPGPWERATVLG